MLDYVLRIPLIFTETMLAAQGLVRFAVSMNTSPTGGWHYYVWKHFIFYLTHIANCGAFGLCMAVCNSFNPGSCIVRAAMSRITSHLIRDFADSL